MSQSAIQKPSLEPQSASNADVEAFFEKAIKTFPNQKLWIDDSIRAKLKARTTAFNQGKVTRNMTEYK